MQDRTERSAQPGETCTCGQPAVVVYVTADHGDVPYCGIPHVAPALEAEDIRIERARLALTEYVGADLGAMTVPDMAGWLGRFAVVLENLLECAEGQPAIVHPDPQRRGHELLGRLLKRCTNERLPLLHWEISTFGMLTGRCTAPDATRRRSDFETWMAALGLFRWPDKTRKNGAVVWQAVREDVDGVDVQLLTEVKEAEL